MLNQELIAKRNSKYRTFIYGDKREILKSQEILELWKIKLSKNKAEVGLYIHVPFCSDICIFCDCYTDKIKKKRLEEYLSILIKEVKIYSKAFKKKKIATLYFGGGTPSVLSEAQLAHLLEILFQSFNLNDVHFSFEASPTTISLAKIDILNKYRVDRITIGIQSFDKQVLKRNNRPGVNYGELKKIVKYAQKSNIRVNLELIQGLSGQTKESFLRDIDLLSKLDPDQVNIYDLIVNNLTLSADLKNNQSCLFKEDKEIIERKKNLYMNYEKSTLDQGIKDDVSKNQQIYNTRFSNHSLLGLGDGALSKIDTKHIYSTFFAKKTARYFRTTKVFNKYSELV